jgi:hypothetical protein
VPAKDINQVMAEHSKEIMGITGVVGVGVGALENGTPCILVLIAKDTPELRKKIPGQLEGHPVVIDVSGEIRALSDEED